MAALRPLGNSVLFTFVDRIERNVGTQQLVRDTKSGIVIAGINFDEQAKSCRWAKVLAVGPEVTDITINDFIYLPPLRWTTGFELDGIKIWKTDEKEILLVSDKPEYEY